MKKINYGDFLQLRFKQYRALVSPQRRKLVTDLDSLGVGECALFTKDECDYKGGLVGTVSIISRKLGKKLTVRTLEDESGWVVRRLS